MNTAKPGKNYENIDEFRYESVQKLHNRKLSTFHSLFHVTADRFIYSGVFLKLQNFSSGLLFFFPFFHSYVLPEISLSCASTNTHTRCRKPYRIKFVHLQTDKYAASHTDRHIYLYNRRH